MLLPHTGHTNNINISKDTICSEMFWQSGRHSPKEDSFRCGYSHSSFYCLCNIHKLDKDFVLSVNTNVLTLRFMMVIWSQTSSINAYVVTLFPMSYCILFACIVLLMHLTFLCKTYGCYINVDLSTIVKFVDYVLCFR